MTLRLLFLLPVAFIFVRLSAQKVGAAREQTDWIMSSTKADFEYSTSQELHPTFGRHTLIAGDKEQIIPALVGKGDWAVLKVNSSGKVIWRYGGEDGAVRGLAWIGSNVAVLTNDKYSQKISMLILDPKKGTKLAENVLLSNKGGYLQGWLQRRPDGQLNNVLFTSSVDKAPVLRAVFIDDKAAITKTIDMPGATYDEYAGAVVNQAGEFFIGEMHDNLFRVSQYSAEGKAIKSLSVPIEIRDNKPYVTLLQLTQDGKELLAAARFMQDKRTYVLQVFRLNFATGKTISSLPRELNSDICKTAELVKIKGLVTGCNHPEGAIPEIMMLVGDQLVLLSQATVTRDNDRGQVERWWMDPWLATYYDNKLKVTKSVGIDLQNESLRFSSLSTGFHRYGDKVIIISPATKIGQTVLTYAELDLLTGKVLKPMVFEEFRHSGPSANEAGATLWFDKTILLEQMDGKVFSKVIKGTFIPVQLD